jgi:hypothetical protein
MAMGFLWLSTVPLTNGTVATLFGVRNLSMLGGIVFLFHQLGAFLGGWLGGVVYDQTGSYDLIWQVSIVLSLLAAALNVAGTRAACGPLAVAGRVRCEFDRGIWLGGSGAGWPYCCWRGGAGIRVGWP